MEARFITDLSQLISETQQQVLQRLMFVDQRLSQQVNAMGEVMNAALPLLKAVTLSDKTRSREINAILTTAQQDLEILFADMAFLSETLDRLSTLSDATLRALDLEADRIAATLQQYRAKLFGMTASKEAFRHVEPMTANNGAAAADLAMLIKGSIDPASLQAIRSPASFDQDLKGYTLQASSVQVNPADFALKVTGGHPNAVPGTLDEAADPNPESAWKETLLVDSLLSGGAQCDLEVTFKPKRTLNKIVVSPFNSTVVVSVKLYVAPSEAEAVEPMYMGYPLLKDADGSFYVKPPELQNLSEENSVILLDHAVPVQRIVMRLAQIRYTTVSADLKIQGLKPLATNLDAERNLYDQQWSRLLEAEMGKAPVPMHKYCYLYGIKDLRFFSVDYSPMARFISQPIVVDRPVSSLYLSTTERTVWKQGNYGPLILFNEASGEFHPELPIEAFIDYRVRVLDQSMLDDPERYRERLTGEAGDWAPRPILTQEHRQRYGEWLYDWLRFKRVDTLDLGGEVGAWVAPLATRPLDWASDPFGTTVANSPRTAALYQDGYLIRPNAEGLVNQFRFVTHDETYGLHIAVPYSIVPPTTDMGAIRLVAVYRPDPTYLDGDIVPAGSQQRQAEVFTTSGEVALADADQSAISASGATMVAPGSHELILAHAVAPDTRPSVTRRNVDGSYTPLFQQVDPSNPNLYRTVHGQVRLESVRFNGRPLSEVFGSIGEQDPFTGHVTLDLTSHPQGGVLTYLYGPSGAAIPRSATEVASVRQDFSLDGNRLLLSKPLKEGELVKVDYTYYRYALVLDARLQRLGMDPSVTPSITSFSLGGDIA